MAEKKKGGFDLSDMQISRNADEQDFRDPRHIESGWDIPTESYSDQPKIVRTDDGAWLCTITTGAGREGEGGQHVISTRSTDRGRSWSKPIAVEPADGPEASYACLLKVQSGRIYCFYNYNGENTREIKTDPVGLPGYEGPDPYPDGIVRRVDSQGHFVFRYSDDNGLSWGTRRYRIPVRTMEIDRSNVYGGSIQFFWNVANPLVYNGAAYVSLHKVGGFGPGFFVRNEGVLLKSNNILEEPDPEKIEWETLPDGDIGLRTPPGGGPVAGEQSYVTLSDGSFFSIYRTVDGYPTCTYSRDGGHSWSEPTYSTYDQGRKMKNPRAANFAWKTTDGRYLYWFHNNGGPVVPELMKRSASYPYENRNPVWICGGIEGDSPSGKIIRWSEPEIVLYDDDPMIRMSYPDLIEEEGEFYLAETQKDIARIHPLSSEFLEALWAQFDADNMTDDGLSAKYTAPEAGGGGSIAMPLLKPFLERDSARADHGAKHIRAGFTIELITNLASTGDGEILLDSRTPDHRGIVVTSESAGRVKIEISDGQSVSSWTSDTGMFEDDVEHHTAIIVDGGPNVIMFVVDGVVNDGGEIRQFGWGRLSPSIRDVNASESLRIGAAIRTLRFYTRALTVTEVIGNYRFCK
jgi:hypothetical protein